MSSILTNTSAMIALQTLKGINTSLGKVQSEISTGKSIASARDNAAIWAISKVMDSDVKGFEAISSSLNLGASSVTVARKAAETISSLLTDMKQTIVNAQEKNLDRAKLQTDVEGLTEQIKSIVSAAQFNGLNLINGSDLTNNVNGQPGINILSSLDRASDGKVTASHVSVNAHNLATTGEATDLAPTVSAFAATLGAATPGTPTAGTTSITGFSFVGGASAAPAADAGNLASPGLREGDIISVTIGSKTGTYTVALDDTLAEVMEGLETDLLSSTGGELDADITLDFTQAGTIKIDNDGTSIALQVAITRDSASFDTGFLTFAAQVPPSTTSAVTPTTTSITGLSFQGGGVALAKTSASVDTANTTDFIAGDTVSLSIAVAGGTATEVKYTIATGDSSDAVMEGLKAAWDARNLNNGISLTLDPTTGLKIDNAGASGIEIAFSASRSSGGLAGLSGLNVTTDAGASSALTEIEFMMQIAIDAAAAFGAAGKRIDLQADFIGNLTDAMTSGIGSLVDADMEEASARLQALQTQQQLGIQALSIANQAPQNILSLFR